MSPANGDLNINFIVDPEQAVLKGMSQAPEDEDNKKVEDKQQQPSVSQNQVVATNTDLSHSEVAQRLRRHGRAHHRIDNIDQLP